MTLGRVIFFLTVIDVVLLLILLARSIDPSVYAALSRLGLDEADVVIIGSADEKIESGARSEGCGS